MSREMPNEFVVNTAGTRYTFTAWALRAVTVHTRGSRRPLPLVKIALINPHLLQFLISAAKMLFLTMIAIRAVHLPTGIVAISRDERSQIANRRRALSRLSILVARREKIQAHEAQQQRWDAHNELVRGNPARVYEGEEFILLFPLAIT